MKSGILKYCQVYLYKIMVSKMNPLFKIFMDAVFVEHSIEELSNENLHDDIEKEYNKIVEDYKKQKENYD